MHSKKRVIAVSDEVYEAIEIFARDTDLNLSQVVRLFLCHGAKTVGAIQRQSVETVKVEHEAAIAREAGQEELDRLASSRARATIHSIAARRFIEAFEADYPLGFRDDVAPEVVAEDRSSANVS